MAVITDQLPVVTEASRDVEISSAVAGAVELFELSQPHIVTAITRSSGEYFIRFLHYTASVVFLSSCSIVL